MLASVGQQVALLLLLLSGAAQCAGVLVFARFGGRSHRVWIPEGSSPTQMLSDRFGVAGLVIDRGVHQPLRHLQHVTLRQGYNEPRLAIEQPPDGFVTSRSSVGVMLDTSRLTAGETEHCTVRLHVDNKQMTQFPCETNAPKQEFVLSGLSIGKHKLKLSSPADVQASTFEVVAPAAATQSNWPLKCRVVWHQDSIRTVANLKTRPVVVLLHNDTVPWWRFQPATAESCDTPIVVAEEMDCPEEADAVIWGCWNQFLSPGPYRRKPPHQHWMYFCVEAARTDPRMHVASFTDQFDSVSTYALNSTFPRLYSPPNERLLFRQVGPRTELSVPIVWVASHCDRFNGKIHRDTFVQQLSQHLPVHAMGRCGNNKPFPQITPENGSALVPIYRRYPFTLALHDATDDYYVDEKLYLPLIAGSVPVVSGPSNLALFAPRGSYIDISHFESPKAVAAHLRYLLQNQTAYDEYLEWKRRPLSPHMRDVLSKSMYVGEQYGEASHHGFPTPLGICDFSRFFIDAQRRQSVTK